MSKTKKPKKFRRVDCKRCGESTPLAEINKWNGQCAGCNFETADRERVKFLYGSGFPY